MSAIIINEYGYQPTSFDLLHSLSIGKMIVNLHYMVEFVFSKFDFDISSLLSKGYNEYFSH
jgi:hypothetical protein